MEKELIWEESETWKARGKKFLVEVKHWVAPGPTQIDDGRQRWNVYAYIYQDHPFFEKINPKGGMAQPALKVLPFHSYVSFFKVWYEEGSSKIGSFQIGSDYGHIHDEKYSFFKTKEESYQIFNDAADLYEWLSNYEKKYEKV